MSEEASASLVPVTRLHCLPLSMPSALLTSYKRLREETRQEPTAGTGRRMEPSLDHDRGNKVHLISVRKVPVGFPGDSRGRGEIS